MAEAGTVLGHYEILSLCGAGGMGEVYRARDRTLGREVAIKLLPDRFSTDRERLARFEREARILGSLNHPNIATLHGIEEAQGRRFLVMELVPGETLGEKLHRGKLPWQECLPLFIAMADGLECAHEAGIVHRDLKPSNVKITPSGIVKILDFGLAKALTEDAAPSAESKSPTLGFVSTGSGVVLGTTPYLSPEQARGDVVDRRSDIWAFGCVLYEALTGRRAFFRGTLSETLAAILEREPDWEALPERVPPRLRALLERCLQKDPRARLRDIGDARLELAACLSERTPSSGAAVARSARRWLGAVPWVLAGVLATAAILLFRSTPRMPERETAARFEIAMPAGEVFGLNYYPSGNVALSRDGRTLAYVTMKEGVTRLQVRSLGEIEPRTLRDTEGAYDPFFSPDGEWLGFFALGAMWKIALRGGPRSTICPVPPVSRGATWMEDGTIVFAPTFSGGLLRVSANGGEPSVLTTPDSGRGEIAHLWPHALPGGREVLFTIWSGGSFDTASVVSLSLSTGRIGGVVQAGSYPQYSDSGHLLFLRSGALLAQPFEVETLEAKGDPFTVVDRVMASALTGAGEYAVSRSGTLAYVAGDPAPGRALLWVDRNGRAEPVAPTADVRRDFTEVRLSPDGKLVAVGILNDIWTYELDRGSFHRLTSVGVNQCPVWSPDGSEITFSHAGPEEPRLFRVAVDGTGLSELFPPAPLVQMPFSWSPDGIVLAYAETAAAALTKGPDDWDVMMLRQGKDPFAFVRQDFDQGQPMFSPDGKLVAYVSTESNMPQVFVRPYPEGSPTWLVSPERGEAPMWSSDGKEIFYRDGHKVLAVSVRMEPAFAAARPRVLFEDTYLSYAGVDGCSVYDVAPDGRFLMIEKAPPESAPRSLQIVLNWPGQLASH
jgi:serine/threonine-protein kinase